MEQYTGIVIEDKDVQSRQVRVYLREALPFAGGELKDNSRKEQYSIKDDKGQTISGNVKTSNHVVADYYGGATNSAFPPCVVKGEQVNVFKLPGEDKYYWSSMGRDDNLRKGDIIRHQASNDMSDNKTLSEDNTYFMEVDTKLAKRIRLHTSKSNGEAFGYDISIDAANSNVTIGDDVGNNITLDSKTNKLTLANKDGSTICLDGKNVIIIAAQDMVIKAGGTLYIEEPTIKGGTTNGGTVNGGTFNGPTVTGPNCSCC